MKITSMEMKKMALVLSMILSVIILNAQADKCYSDNYLGKKLASNADYQKDIDALYERASILAERDKTSKVQMPLITIPVVVHILYNQSVDNLSMERIQSQIDVLNEDYRRQNADASNTPSSFSSIAVDAEIEFCLASIDPNGNQTDGVVRVQTNVSNFDVDNDQIKYTSQGGSNGWDRDNYLNIWVGRLESGILGYASFPTSAWTAAEDGVAIGTQFFGRGFTGISSQYSEGRTTTHEVGHWLGLRHIWGDGACGADDGISDTPTADDPYYGCPSLGTSSTSCGSQDMYMNYMDYVDDDCMNVFTAGQKAVMQATLSDFRLPLTQSAACTPDFALDMEVLFGGEPGLSCSEEYSAIIQLRNNGTTTITSATLVYTVNNGPQNSYTFTGTLTAGQFTNITLFTAVLSGAQDVEVQITSVNGGSDQYSPNNTAVTTYQGAVYASTPLTESFGDASFDQPGWSIENPDDDSFEWQYYENVSAGGTAGGSAFFDNFGGDTDSNPGGTVDEIITPLNDVSGQGTTLVTFDLAYTYYQNQSEILTDGLSVAYSVDCGNSWQQLWYKEGADLATATPHSNAFIPEDNEWEYKFFTITGLENANDLLIKFTNHSGWGNNMWIDNININTLVSVPEALSPAYNISLYPNPSIDGKVHLKRDLIDQDFKVEIIDVTGRIIRENIWSGSQISLNLTDQQSGIYLVRVISDDTYSTYKVLIGSN